MIKLKKIIIDNQKEYISIKYFDENENRNFKFKFYNCKNFEDMLKTEFLKEIIEEKINNPNYKKARLIKYDY